MDKDILNRVNIIFQDVLAQPNLKLNVSDNAATIEGWDSLNHIYLITEIQKEFSIKFSIQEVRSIDKISSLLGLINEKLN